MITVEEFLEFYESDAYDDLDAEHKHNIFITCLAGSSDITKDLLNELLDNYGVSNLEIKEIK